MFDFISMIIHGAEGIALVMQKMSEKDGWKTVLKGLAVIVCGVIVICVLPFTFKKESEKKTIEEKSSKLELISTNTIDFIANKVKEKIGK